MGTVEDVTHVEIRHLTSLGIFSYRARSVQACEHPSHLRDQYASRLDVEKSTNKTNWASAQPNPYGRSWDYCKNATPMHAPGTQPWLAERQHTYVFFVEPDGGHSLSPVIAANRPQ